MTRAYGKRLVVVKIGMEDVHIGPAYLGGNFLLSRGNVASQAKNSVRGILRELAKELKLIT